MYFFNELETLAETPKKTIINYYFFNNIVLDTIFCRIFDYVYINWNITAKEKAYSIFLKIM